MMDRDGAIRVLHDVGLAAWFGGSLMGVLGLHRAAVESDDPLRAADRGWAAWNPVQATAIAAHVAGAVGITWANRGRLVAQRGAAPMGAAKAAVTVAALAATASVAVVGHRVGEAAGAPAAGPTDPEPATPTEVAHDQRALAAVQWLVPALTGTLVVMNALMGEQQRPKHVVAGLARRLVRGR